MYVRKILVINTGGTIGSKSKDGIININKDSTGQLIEHYIKKYGGDDSTFDVMNLLDTLSENITPAEWGVLCKAMSSIDTSQYTGIIITHGSDTLAYTSALVGLMYNHFNIPIVLTAANLPPEHKDSNAFVNFNAAAEFITRQRLAGVFVIYTQSVYRENFGKRTDTNIYIATRLMEASAHNDCFDCVGAPIGTWQANNINSYIDISTMTNSHRANEPMFPADISFTESVLFIKPYVGIDYDMFNIENLAKKPKAVLHELYHSASACVKGERYDMINFINRCKAQGIEVYVTPFKPVGTDIYETSNRILQVGAKPIYGIPPIAAYVKLMILYNQTKYSVDDMINQELYFECVGQETAYAY